MWAVEYHKKMIELLYRWISSSITSFRKSSFGIQQWKRANVLWEVALNGSREWVCFVSRNRTLLKMKAPLIHFWKSLVGNQKVNKCSCQQPGLVTFNVPVLRIIRFIIIVLVLTNIITMVQKYLHNNISTDNSAIKIINILHYSEIIKSVKLAE